MENELSLVYTADGSHSLWSSKFQEEYHSSKGAIVETEHTYIKMGLQHVLESGNVARTERLRVFELSLGTGLSAVMSALHQSEQDIHYECIEPFPISLEQANALNYGDKIPGATHVLTNIHTAKWGEDIEITSHFTLKKHQCGISEYNIPSHQFHLIYMDAFSPKIQPDVWEPQVLTKLYDGLCENGVLVTYSAAGFVRRHYESLGAKVERQRGANGKREMLRITKLECRRCQDVK